MLWRPRILLAFRAVPAPLHKGTGCLCHWGPHLQCGPSCLMAANQMVGWAGHCSRLSLNSVGGELQEACRRLSLNSKRKRGRAEEEEEEEDQAAAGKVVLPVVVRVMAGIPPASSQKPSSSGSGEDRQDPGHPEEPRTVPFTALSEIVRSRPPPIRTPQSLNAKTRHQGCPGEGCTNVRRPKSHAWRCFFPADSQGGTT